MALFFRMLGLQKSLQEKDECDQDISKELEEAIEDNLSTETQVSQEEKEGQAENTADPPRTKYADVVKDPPSRKDTEIGWKDIYSREYTLLSKHRKIAENTAIPEASLKLGGTVENTTAPPSAAQGRRGRRSELENTGAYSLGGIVENTTITPDSTHRGGEDSGEPENTGIYTVLLEEPERATSPTTSTPSSTPSPSRHKMRDSELQESDMSCIDSSVA